MPPSPLTLLIARLLGAALLSNVLFFTASTWLDLGRPLINLDYAICGLLIAGGYTVPGALAALLLIALDAIALIGQIIPLPRLSDLIYLASFSSLLATRHLLLLGALTGACLTSWILLISTYKTLPLRPTLVLTGIIATLSLCSTLGASEKTRFYRLESSLVGSQAQALLRARSDLFVSLAQAPGEGLKPLPPHAESASEGLKSSTSSRILLIVAESWGAPKDPAIQRALLAPLASGPLTLTGEGKLHFSGVTLAAELRELCRASLLGYNLREVTEGFETCLPNALRAAGYATAALHGAGGPMYDRMHWYPRAGFQRSDFFENIDVPYRCYSFPGACDLDLMEHVATYFSAPGKRFLYWLTLNSHAPYDERDIRQDLFDCALYKVPEPSETCRNLKLQAQFFDGLARLIRSGSLQGTDVLIVGDHAPVLLDRAEKTGFFELGTVPWLRLTTQ